MVVIKIKLAEDVRRISFPDGTLTWSVLKEKITKLYSFPSHSSFSVKYVDDDKDLITISSDEELEEAIDFTSTQVPPVLRLVVGEKNPSPGVGCPPQTNAGVQTPQDSLQALMSVLGAQPHTGEIQMQPLLGTISSLASAILGQGVVLPPQGGQPKAEAAKEEEKKEEVAEEPKSEEEPVDQQQQQQPTKEEEVTEEPKSEDEPVIEEPKSEDEPVVQQFGEEVKKEDAPMLQESSEEPKNEQEADLPLIQGQPKEEAPLSTNYQSLSARFINDLDVFDGTKVISGTILTKSWQLLNSGEVPWPADCYLGFVSGDIPAYGEERGVILYDRLGAVEPDELVIVKATLQPYKLGRVQSYFRMFTPDKKPFGERVWVDIEVLARKKETPAPQVSMPTVPADPPSPAPVAVAVNIPQQPPQQQQPNTVVPEGFVPAINSLKEMGFSDVPLLVELLTRHSGDIQLVVSQLLGGEE